MKKKNSKALYYPLALNLRNKLVLVIGGGRVAEKKIEKLLEAKARIKVISPDITPKLRRLFIKGSINWVPRVIRSTDLHSAAIVIAATSDSCVNKLASQWSRQQGILVNVVDDASMSDFISPAVFRKKKAVIAVYTNGQDPVLSRDLKNFLKEHWDVFLSYRNKL